MNYRRLTAIMVTDMVGFTAVIATDQEKALALIERAHEVIRSMVLRHRGEWLEDPGDRTLSAFPSAINAVECALDIQTELKNDTDVQLRIGVEIGDIVVTDNHVYGGAINIASMIERFADPDGLVITDSVYEAVQNHMKLNVINLGEKMLKNVKDPVRLYALTGAKIRHPLKNLLSSLMARRVPHIAGAYLAACWVIVEFMDWLVGLGAIDQKRVLEMLAGMLAIVPSVLLVAYTHGAHGRENISEGEKIFVPMNVVLAILLVMYVRYSV